MMRHHAIRAAAALITIVFLVFLGMRNSLLDKTSKPKPRPRAVLNQAKTLSSTASATKPDHLPPFDALPAKMDLHPLPACLLATPLSPIKRPATSGIIAIPNDRSPPRC